MASPEKTMERKTLTITQLKEVERVGERQIEKLSFKAKDKEDVEGKELWYFSFRTSLFDAIKEGATINADVETSSREYDGNTYVDRRVVQIYVDGQPLGSKGRGSSWGGKSPQEIASIENQVRAKLIVELRTAGVFDDKHPTYKKCLSWLDKLEATIVVPKQESSRGKVVEEPFEEAKTTPATITTLKETMQECNWSAQDVGHYGVNVKFWKFSEYSDLQPDQIAELIEHIKKNPK